MREEADVNNITLSCSTYPFGAQDSDNTYRSNPIVCSVFHDNPHIHRFWTWSKEEWFNNNNSDHNNNNKKNNNKNNNKNRTFLQSINVSCVLGRKNSQKKSPKAIKSNSLLSVKRTQDCVVFLSLCLIGQQRCCYQHSCSYLFILIRNSIVSETGGQLPFLNWSWRMFMFTPPSPEIEAVSSFWSRTDEPGSAVLQR